MSERSLKQAALACQSIQHGQELFWNQPELKTIQTNMGNTTMFIAASYINFYFFRDNNTHSISISKFDTVASKRFSSK